MREFRHHLSMASGSVAEVETLLLLTRQLGYTDTSTIGPALTTART